MALGAYVLVIFAVLLAAIVISSVRRTAGFDIDPTSLTHELKRQGWQGKFYARKCVDVPAIPPSDTKG